MRQLDLKKLLLPNLPYLLIGLYATKLGEAWRLAPGADASAKLLGLMDGFAAAFQSALPSFHPVDLLVGLCCGAALRLAVYFKGKNAKKYRKNMEYGSARWGTAEDIKPFMDPVFENNIILTQTERLTMNSRPKDPRTARNKNVLIIGGSGSGRRPAPDPAWGTGPSDFRAMTPATSKTMILLADITASLKVTVPLTLRLVTCTTFPPLPPVTSLP